MNIIIVIYILSYNSVGQDTKIVNHPVGMVVIQNY